MFRFDVSTGRDELIECIWSVIGIIVQTKAGLGSTAQLTLGQMLKQDPSGLRMARYGRCRFPASLVAGLLSRGHL